MLDHGRTECTACDGGGELAATGEAYHLFASHQRERIRRLQGAARLAMKLAKVYRLRTSYGFETSNDDPGSRNDDRITAIAEQVATYRATIRAHRASMRHQPGEILAWCTACRGTGLADIECEGCGGPVDVDTLDEDAHDNVNVLVHRGCDTGHRYFESHAAAGGCR